MSALQIKLQRLAKEDLRDAHLWYEKQAPGLGADFLREVVGALRKVAAQPLLYRVIEPEFSVRRVLIKRFPYKAFFTIEPNRIVIHAIIRSSRSETSWTERCAETICRKFLDRGMSSIL